MSAPGTNDGCDWCGQTIAPDARRDARFCGRKCRQAAWRLRRLGSVAAAGERPLRVAYADPPYPGTARRYYQHEPNYAGEVNHGELLSLLQQFDGWALSTSARALQDVLPCCPSGVRVCAWIKPHGASPATRGLHNVWEPLLVRPARNLRPGVRDALVAHAARGGGKLPGRKPIAFCVWLFQALGMRAGDTFADLFPGSGVVSAAWEELSFSAENDASLVDGGDA